MYLVCLPSATLGVDILEMSTIYGKEGEIVTTSISFDSDLTPSQQVNAFIVKAKGGGILDFISPKENDTIYTKTSLQNKQKITISFTVPTLITSENWELHIRMSAEQSLSTSFFLYKENFARSFYLLMVLVGASFGILLFIVVHRFRILHKIIFISGYAAVLYFSLLKDSISNPPPADLWNIYIAGLCFLGGSILAFWQFRSLIRRKY